MTREVKLFRELTAGIAQTGSPHEQCNQYNNLLETEVFRLRDLMNTTTKLYYISARTLDDHDCSVFVEDYGPMLAKVTWMGWCDWCGLDYDLEDLRIFEVPTPAGRPRTFQWGVDMEDVTP